MWKLYMGLIIFLATLIQPIDFLAQAVVSIVHVLQKKTTMKKSWKVYLTTKKEGLQELWALFHMY